MHFLAADPKGIGIFKGLKRNPFPFLKKNLKKWY